LGRDTDVPSYIGFQQTPLENFQQALALAISGAELF
jgi:hypothetical protein